MKKSWFFAGLVLLPVMAFGEPHVRETLELAKGWNAVYIESTPVAATCDEFFADTPVVAAAAYRSDADAATAQYDAEGREIVQAPVEFLTWVRDEPVSTLQGIVGGKAFLLYATNAAAIVLMRAARARRFSFVSTFKLCSIVFYQFRRVKTANATLLLAFFYRVSRNNGR